MLLDAVVVVRLRLIFRKPLQMAGNSREYTPHTRLVVAWIVKLVILITARMFILRIIIVINFIDHDLRRYLAFS